MRELLVESLLPLEKFKLLFVLLLLLLEHLYLSVHLCVALSFPMDLGHQLVVVSLGKLNFFRRRGLSEVI